LDCIATPNNVGYKIRFSLLLQLLLILILFSSILSLEILSLEMRSESRYVRNALATDGTKRRNKGNRMPQLLEIDRNNGGEDEDGESSSIEIVDDDFEEQVKQNAKRRAIQSSAKEQTKAKKKKRQKKRQGPLSWVSHTIEFVPYDYVKLNQTAKSTIDARKKADGLAFQEPTEMVRCLLASLPSQKVGHSEYALKSQTSNYKRHLDSFHPDCVTWMEKAFEEDANPSALATSFKHFVSTKSRQPPTPGKITNLFPLIKKSKSLNPTYRKELSFLVWMIEAENSFHGIDLESFKTMKKEMNAGLRSRRTLMKLLGAIYAVALESMERVISKCGFFSTTFDYWHGQGEDFLGVTYHTCQHDFVLRSFVLDLVYTPGRKFISNVYIQVKQCIETHTSIESLHAASVTDRAKNVLGASAMLVGDEDAEKCINHEIKSIIDDVFCGSDARDPMAPLAAGIFKFVVECVQWIRSSKLESDRFYVLQEEVDNSSLQLVVDNITRWEGKYQTVSRFLALKETLQRMYKDADMGGSSVFKDAVVGNEQLLDASFWVHLGEIKQLSEHFHIASKYLQGEKYVTVSSIPYWICQLRHCCVRREHDTMVCVELKEALLQSLNNRCDYYTTTVNNSLKAAALDPRFADLTQFGVSNQLIRECWNSIIQDQKALTASEEEDNAVVDVDNDLVDQMLKLQVQILERELVKQSMLFQQDVNATIKSVEYDPLVFWRKVVQNHDDITQKIPSTQFRNTLKAFAPVAALLFSIPAGSSPSEREFSSAGRTYTNLRNLLSDATLEQLVVVRHFMKQDEYSFESLVTLVEQRLENERQ